MVCPPLVTASWLLDIVDNVQTIPHITWRYCFTTPLLTYPGMQTASDGVGLEIFNYLIFMCIHSYKKSQARYTKTPQSWRYCFTTTLLTYPGMQIPHPDGAHSHCYFVALGLDI